MLGDLHKHARLRAHGIDRTPQVVRLRGDRGQPIHQRHAGRCELRGDPPIQQRLAGRAHAQVARLGERRAHAPPGLVAGLSPDRVHIRVVRFQLTHHQLARPGVARAQVEHDVVLRAHAGPGLEDLGVHPVPPAQHPAEPEHLTHLGRQPLVVDHVEQPWLGHHRRAEQRGHTAAVRPVRGVEPEQHVTDLRPLEEAHRHRAALRRRHAERHQPVGPHPDREIDAVRLAQALDDAAEPGRQRRLAGRVADHADDPLHGLELPADHLVARLAEARLGVHQNVTRVCARMGQHQHAHRSPRGRGFLPALHRSSAHSRLGQHRREVEQAACQLRRDACKNKARGQAPRHVPPKRAQPGRGSPPAPDPVVLFAREAAETGRPGSDGARRPFQHDGTS